MTTSITLMLTLASLALLVKGHRKLAIAFQLSSILWLALIGSGITSKIVMDSLEVYPRQDSPLWKNKNIIVLLSGGSFKWNDRSELSTAPPATSRILETARLYFLCRKQSSTCKILSSGGDPRRKGMAEGKIMANQLMDLEIPESDILVEDKSKNTFENAKFSAPIIKSLVPNQIYLVTSGSHLKRSKILFDHFGIQVVPSPADEYNFRLSLIPNSSNMYWSDIGLHEYGGMLKFYIFNLIGLDY